MCLDSAEHNDKKASSVERFTLQRVAWLGDILQRKSHCAVFVAQVRAGVGSAAPRAPSAVVLQVGADVRPGGAQRHVALLRERLVLLVSLCTARARWLRRALLPWRGRCVQPVGTETLQLRTRHNIHSCWPVLKTFMRWSPCPVAEKVRWNCCQRDFSGAPLHPQSATCLTHVTRATPSHPQVLRMSTLARASRAVRPSCISAGRSWRTARTSWRSMGRRGRASRCCRTGPASR